MGALINGGKITLVVWTAGAFYFTWYLMLNNGTADFLSQMKGHGPHVLPGTEEPLKRIYTGIPRLDRQLVLLTVFFWKVVDGSMPGASLQAFLMIGQFGGAYGLMILEGLRTGNRGRAVSFIVVWGLLIQNLSYACVMPLYLLIQLWTSPTASFPTLSNTSISNSDLISIPISLTIGFVLPSILLAFPAPSMLSFDTKQTIITLWQAFPIWVAMIQPSTSLFVSKLFPPKDRVPSPTNEPPTRSRSTLRFVYIYLLLIGGLVHFAARVIEKFSELFPNVFAPEYRNAFNANNMWMPVAAFPSYKMSSLGQGVQLFLQYDEIMGSGSTLIWATVTFIQAYNSYVGPFRALFMLIFVYFVSTNLIGPVGFAICALWARDELLFGNGRKESKKSQ